jgi:glycogen debranching enzyme
VVRRRMRVFLAAAALAAFGLLSASTASAGAQTVQTAGSAQRSAGGTLAAAARAVPGAGAAPTISATSQLSERRFVAAGTDAYVVGVEDGTFPPIGWHTTGQMGGVFTPPIKLLDGLWFGLSGSWLDSATTYTSGPGFVRLTFPVTDGLQPTLTEFAPDGQPAVLFGLTLVPVKGSATTVTVTADAHSEVSATYPWGSTTPTWDQFNNQNTVSAANDVITFNQEQTPWYAEVGSATAPSGTATGSGYWGPTSASDQAVLGTKGEGGQLTWNLAVPATGRTLWLGVAGSQNGPASAGQALQAALVNPAGLLQSKIAERDGVAAQTSLEVPDAGVQQALLWSKLNLADLSRTIANAAIRDTEAGTVYPAPLATVPQVSAIDAAYPDYAEFFGTDGAYSTYGLAVSGQWQTAANWLNAMRTVSEIVNGSTGKVVHEVTATGAVYYGDTTEPGDINETAQFAIAADLVWRWSGDNAVLADNYKFIYEGEHYLASLATGPDHLWPVGDGIVENPSLGGEALDVAAETIQALAALHDMAVAMNDTSTARWAAQRENAMLNALDQWWISSQHLYADSMCTAASAGTSCTAPGQQLQQRWWTSVAPMEQDIAPVADADAALSQMETPTFTGSCGLFVDGVGGPMGASGQTCYLVNTGALAVGEANYGRLPQAVTDMGKIASQLTVEMPGSLPELAASAQYNPLEAFTSRANVMQAWSGYGLLWTVVNDLLGVSPDAPTGSVAVVPEVPSSWPTMSVGNLHVGTSTLGETASRHGAAYRTGVTGAQGLALTIGTVLAAGATVHSVTLNGVHVPYQLVTTHRGTAVEVSVPHPAADEVLAVQA